MDSNHCLTLNNGLKMPIIGLGTWQATAEELKTAVTTAIEAGYRHIDTAFVYFNEAAIGDVLQELIAAGKIKREEIFITTKLPSNGHRKVEHFLKLSLKALKVDYVDLYLIHSPLAGKGKSDEDFFPTNEDKSFAADLDADLVDTWKAMEHCVEAGLTKSIGVSNFNSEQIRRIYAAAKIKPANLQVECHAYFPQHELFDFCTKLGISFTAYAPFGSPGLAAYAKQFCEPEKLPKFPNLFEDETVKNIAAKHGKKISQVLLRYLIQRGICVIPKSANPGRIIENIEVFDFELNQDEVFAMNNLNVRHRMFKFDWHPSVLELKEYPFHIPF